MANRKGLEAVSRREIDFVTVHKSSCGLCKKTPLGRVGCARRRIPYNIVFVEFSGESGQTNNPWQRQTLSI